MQSQYPKIKNMYKLAFITYAVLQKKFLYATVKKGFGFSNTENMATVDRGAPDLLRRDFVEGTDDTSFLIDAPKKQYELFVVSVDESEDSITFLNQPQRVKSGK